MRYWDASALVSLCVEEDDSTRLRRLAGEAIVTWAMSRVEIASAIERRSREHRLTAEGRLQAMTALHELADSWTEIHSIAPVSDRALRLLAIHPLRAADAMQLAAALVAVLERPRGHEFVCTDQRLCEAASREGFGVLPVAG